MTISTTKRKAGPYQGDGEAATFPFDFKIFELSDLRVISADKSGAEHDLELYADYTVLLNEEQETLPGGSVILNTAPPDGCSITLTSDMPYLQPTKLTNHGGFYPAVINDALDRLTIFVQQLEEQVDRSIKVTVSSKEKPDELMTSLKNSESAARQSAESAHECEQGAIEHAEIAKSATDALEGGLNDLAGVKASITEVRTDVDDLQKAILPATMTEIQNGQAGRLVDAAALKSSIAMQQEIKNGNTGKLVDAAGLVKYMSDRFAIIYPNGGSEQSPALITKNSRYVMGNPFPGRMVACNVEIFFNGAWGALGWGCYGVNSVPQTIGAKASQFGGDIVVQTAVTNLLAASSVTGSPHNNTNIVAASAPARVKVWVID